MIRRVKSDDAQQICNIYNYYIRETKITFEEVEVQKSEMKERISDVTKQYPWLAFEENGKVLGYAYATRWKGRKAYDFSVETSVYVDKDAGGNGIGSKLYKSLLVELKKLGVHAVIGGVALPNPPSVKLHERMGFDKVAQFPEVGFKKGDWIDVGYWQLNL